MRTTQSNVGAGDGCHTNEVVSTAEESRKCRGEWNLVPNAHTNRGSYHLLLGDVLLKETVREGLGEFLGKGRVAYFTVQGHDIGIGSANRHQRVTIGFAGRDRLASIILWQFHRFFGGFRGGVTLFRLLDRGSRPPCII